MRTVFFPPVGKNQCKIINTEKTLDMARIRRCVRCGGLEQTKERCHSRTQPARLDVGFEQSANFEFKPNRENRNTDFPTSEKGRAKLVLFT
jgi:hypothetical protein